MGAAQLESRLDSSKPRSSWAPWLLCTSCSKSGQMTGLLALLGYLYHPGPPAHRSPSPSTATVSGLPAVPSSRLAAVAAGLATSEGPVTLPTPARSLSALSVAPVAVLNEDRAR